jgi:agmatinase
MIYPILLLNLVAAATAHAGHEQTVLGPHQSLWYNVLPGDGGTQASQLLK